jgi:hypothetical protein
MALGVISLLCKEVNAIVMYLEFHSWALFWSKCTVSYAQEHCIHCLVRSNLKSAVDKEN